MNHTLTTRRYTLGLRLAADALRAFRYWLLAGFVVTFGIGLVVANDLEIGAWAITSSILMWFLGVWSGMVVHTFLPTKLALGVTRREITVALALFGALLSAVAVLIVATGLFAEYALLSAVADPRFTLGDTAARAARYLLVAPLYCCAGMAIGAAEVRMRSNAAQVPVLLAAASVLALVCLSYEFGTWWFPQWTLLGVALVAALAAAAALALRDAPIRPKRG